MAKDLPKMNEKIDITENMKKLHSQVLPASVKMPQPGTMVTEKTCTICFVTKPLSAYYKRSKTKDVYYNVCIECTLKLLRKNPKPIGYSLERILSPEKIVELEKELIANENLKNSKSKKKPKREAKTKIAKRWGIPYVAMMNYWQDKVKPKLVLALAPNPRST